MHDEILSTLRHRRAELRSEWEKLLRQRPINTPLASPDVLRHLMDWTLDEVFAAIVAPPGRRRRKQSAHATSPPCPCGRNPLQTYFSCLEVVFDELIERQFGVEATTEFSECAVVAAEIKVALRVVAHREIEQFCSVCKDRDVTQAARILSETRT